MVNGQEKSDSGIVAVKPTNKAGQPGAELAEPRPETKGNVGQQSTHRAQDRARVTQALDRVRKAARLRKKERLTALLHHVNVDTLRTAFYALRRKAAPGVDGITWRDYEADLEPRLRDLHERVHRGAYRRNRLAGRTYRRRTESSGRWRLQLWRTRSSKGPASWCSTPSTKVTSAASPTGFGPDEDRTMRWTPCAWQSTSGR